MVGSQHMDDAETRIRELLTEAAEINLSELPILLGRVPVRSELVYLLVRLDKDFTAQSREGGWEAFYAIEVLGELGAR
jgi:hypothetical protein